MTTRGRICSTKSWSRCVCRQRLQHHQRPRAAAGAARVVHSAAEPGGVPPSRRAKRTQLLQGICAHSALWWGQRRARLAASRCTARFCPALGRIAGECCGVQQERRPHHRARTGACNPHATHGHDRRGCRRCAQQPSHAAAARQGPAADAAGLRTTARA